MPGVLNMLLAAASWFARKTISVGTDSVFYGYFNGDGVGDFGSLDSLTYSDHGGNTRTIGSIYWTINASTGSVTFELEETSISNSDTTFVSIQLQGFSTVLTRASATYFADNGDGKTRWGWGSLNTSGFPTSGSQILLIS